MKTRFKLFGIISIVALIGLLMAACATAPRTDGITPVLANFKTGVYDNPTDTFIDKNPLTTSERLSIAVSYSYDRTITKWFFTFKNSSGTVLWTDVRSFSRPSASNSIVSIGSWSLDGNPPGTYTFELYCEDNAGTKSNTVTADIVLNY